MNRAERYLTWSLQKPLRALLLVVIAVTAGADPAIATDLKSEIRKIVDEERDRGGTPGMSVVVVRDGQVLVEHASGHADLEAGRVAAVDTLYPAASVSKILTAALVMRQVEVGRLDLDEPVNTYLSSEFWVRNSTGDLVPVTLRQLLSHSAGLPVSWGGIIERGNPVPTLEAYLALGQTVIYPPGKRVIYSNDGFALAGYLAAQAAGQSFPDYARDALFEPLGMTRSMFQSPWQFEGTLAAAYGHWFKGGTGRTDHADTTATAPAGALITTAPDLARFVQMLLGGGAFEGVRILRTGSVAEMMQIQARAHPDLDQGFGLGFAVRERMGRRTVWWDGNLSGAASRLALLPDAGVGVVVLSNLANTEPSAVVGRRILNAVVPPPSAAAYQPSIEELKSVAGLYRLSDFIDPTYWYLKYLLVFEVETQADHLVLRSRITGERVLTPIGRNRFRLTGSGFDKSHVLFDGNEMYLGYLSAQRIPAWQSPNVIIACTVLVTLVFLRFFWRSLNRRKKSVS